MLLTFTDPDRRNAMTAEMGADLAAALAGLAGREDVRAVVLTGAGPAFSGGGDLALLADKAARAKAGEDQTASMREFYGVFLSVVRAPFPVLAAINGHAIGAGACVAGLRPGRGGPGREDRLQLRPARHPPRDGRLLDTARLVGPQRAAELLYTGRLLTGTEAAEYGLALEALPTEDAAAHAGTGRRDRPQRPPAGPPAQAVAGRGRQPHAGRAARRRGGRAGGQLPHQGRRRGPARRPRAPGPPVQRELGRARPRPGGADCGGTV